MAMAMAVGATLNALLMRFLWMADGAGFACLAPCKRITVLPCHAGQVKQIQRWVACRAGRPSRRPPARHGVRLATIAAITCSVTTAGAGPLQRLDGAPVAQAAMRAAGGVDLRPEVRHQPR